MNQQQSIIVQCSGCATKNRVPVDKLRGGAKCGKCGIDLKPAGDNLLDKYTLRCLECGAKNRVAGERIHDGAKCGKCNDPLMTHEIFAAQPMMITDMNFDDQVLKSPLPVLLYAWSPT
jgi:thioredoxin 2